MVAHSQSLRVDSDFKPVDNVLEKHHRLCIHFLSPSVSHRITSQLAPLAPRCISPGYRHPLAISRGLSCFKTVSFAASSPVSQFDHVSRTSYMDGD